MKANYELKNEAKMILTGKRKLLALLATPVFLLNSLSMIFLIIKYWQEKKELFAVFDGAKEIFSTYVPNFFIFTTNFSWLSVAFVLMSIIVAFFMVWMMWVIIGIKRQKIAEFNFITIFKFSPLNKFSLFITGTLLQGIFLFFWTLLLIVPGIIKHYSYALTYFILQEQRKISVSEAITTSRKMMHGNKMKLFLLDLSFLPWHLLNLLTLGISSFWTLSYITATKALFYENLCTEKSFNLSTEKSLSQSA